MIKNTEIAEHNLDEEVNGFKKLDRSLLKDWTTKVNTILKEVKSDNITKTNRLTKTCVIFVGRKEDPKSDQRCCNRTLVEKKNTTINKRTRETYQHFRAEEKWTNLKESRRIN